jgi:hypothetical protein
VSLLPPKLLSPKPLLQPLSLRTAAPVKPAAAPVTTKQAKAPAIADRFESQGAHRLAQGTRLNTGGVIKNKTWEQFNTGGFKPSDHRIPDENWDQALKNKKRPAAPSFDQRTREPLESDGYLVGVDGGAYPPGTSPGDVKPVEPTSGPSDETVIFVNGQGTSPSGFGDDLQDIADATGANVVGVYNATEGLLGDSLQSLNDKKDEGTNAAVETTSDLIYDQITQGQDVRLIGHSQGALILSRSLEDVRQRLLSEGRSEKEVNQLLGQVTVETLGGAATSYPDGPHYTHYINQADFVPRELGLGETNPPLLDATPNVLGVDTHPGAGAQVVQFDEGTQSDRNNPAGNDHSLNTYLNHYSRPEDVASNPDRVKELPDPDAYYDAREEALKQAATNPWALGASILTPILKTAGESAANFAETQVSNVVEGAEKVASTVEEGVETVVGAVSDAWDAVTDWF